MKQDNLYENLLAQAKKVFDHNRQGSNGTKKRYKSGYNGFLEFLAEEYHLQKISNIAPKHVFAYQDFIRNGNWTKM